MIESLAMAGAFDSFDDNRAGIIAGIDDAVDAAQARQREREMGQFNLFGDVADEEPALQAPELPNVPK